ncbi:MAG: transporter substrate-binding domain-containing protein [Myxococcales bacterium]|nr:transporter substrate-binding domain-containing protein [Myxococcales bacterium]
MSEPGGSMAAKGCIVVSFLGALAVITVAAAMFLLSSGDERSTKSVAGPVTDGSPTLGPKEVGVQRTAAPGAALARIKARGRLLVAMDTGEPPLSGTPPMFFVDAQGGRDGFDYALARKIADAAGVSDVELVHVAYSGAEDRLVDPSAGADVLISGYSPTETDGIAWSKPYLEYGLCLVVTARSGVQTTADLFGKKVGIFDDDAAAEDVRKLVKGYTAMTRMENGYWDALARGDFDAFIYDYPYAAAEIAGWYAANPAKAGAFRIAQYNLTDSTYAVGVRAGEADLLDLVDRTIDTWRGSDGYAQAVKRYLKGGEAAVITDVAARKVKVKPGDTLSGIANRELGGTARWKEVWELNKSRFPNPHLIEVGDEVVLPAG